MSVLIKGMDMPPKGDYYITLYVCSDGSAYVDVSSFPAGKDIFEAVSVQPEIVLCRECKHGRLFDTNCVDCEYRELATDADWFFADGERRESDG